MYNPSKSQIVWLLFPKHVHSALNCWSMLGDSPWKKDDAYWELLSDASEGEIDELRRYW
jgi:hypothetical protein